MNKKPCFLFTCFLAVFCVTSFHIKTRAQEPPTISVAIAKLSSDQFDPEQTEQALDDYIFSTLGFHVSLEYLPYTYSGQVMGDYLLRGSLPDVFLMTHKNDYDLLAEGNYLLPLDDWLAEYGSGLTEQCGPQAMAVHTGSDGSCLAVPCIHTRAWSVGFEYRQDIAEKYHLDMEQVHSMEDLTHVFSQLTEQNSDIIPVIDAQWTSWDSLGDSLGVLMEYGQSDTVANLYETEVYAELCHTLSMWRQAGYIIDEDYIQRDVNSFVTLPEVFGKLADYNPSMQWMDEMEAGEPISSISLSDPVILSSAYDMNMWAVSSGTAYPAEAVRFLNALYTDPVIPNLLAYGILHENYEFSDEENGLIRLPDSDGEESRLSYQIRNYLVGNQYLCYKWDNYPADIWQQCMDFDQDALLSNGYGFVFDPQPVAEKVRSCLEVVDLYASALRYGIADVDEMLAEFQTELRRSGIDEVIAEKQRQFTVWKTGGGK